MVRDPDQHLEAAGASPQRLETRFVEAVQTRILLPQRVDVVLRHPSNRSSYLWRAQGLVREGASEFDSYVTCLGFQFDSSVTCPAS